MHGPGPRTETNPLGFEPHWPDLPRIKVVDTLDGTIKKWRRRRIWRRALRDALDRWNQAGLELRVVRRDPADYAEVTHDYRWTQGYAALPKVIRIARWMGTEETNRNPIDWSGYGMWVEWCGGWEFGPDGGILMNPDGSGPICALPMYGSIVVLRPGPIWWHDEWQQELRAYICHEFGHALGLSHRSDHGVMAGGWKPDEHDLESIRRYYLGT